MHPKKALEEFYSQRITLFPPQFYLLTTLSSILEGSRNTAEQRGRIRALSNGAFGRMVINPRVIRDQEAEAEGYKVITYEGDEANGGSPGRRHRCRLKFGPGGVSGPAASHSLPTDHVLIVAVGHIHHPRAQLRHLHRDRAACISRLCQTLTFIAGLVCYTSGLHRHATLPYFYNTSRAVIFMCHCNTPRARRTWTRSMSQDIGGSSIYIMYDCALFVGSSHRRTTLSGDA